MKMKKPLHDQGLKFNFVGAATPIAIERTDALSLKI